MKKKLLIIFLILVFLYCIGGVIYSVLTKSNINEKKTASIISVNNYAIDELKISDLYKNEFQLLKNNLESSQIDYNEYAKSIAKLYIIDLYSLNDKTNKYDITSYQYVYSNSQDNYKLKVSESLYKYIEDNKDGKRSQELPIVNCVNIQSIEESLYNLASNEYKAYNILITWDYDKDLGYDNSAMLTLINDNNVISVVEHKINESIEIKENS